ncbi:hypothetical protein [Pseudonocardia oroxyli]|uniref:Uncharacterized protein n=1 Tax=Pseudonocardia oroxyli TaxID=366584 RepID=A0A1G7UNL9_PSEOR|nr:hypothetical protein [Pseudonocardia oroxyli]SDG48330.1 hypothetical protein SAMN05216377_11282 [Pseudonocardia oroxyli]
MAYADVTMSLEGLAEWLAVPAEDVAFTISETYALDLHEDSVPVDLCADLRRYFGERVIERRSPR